MNEVKTLKRIVAENLTELRKQKGLTQIQLAKKFNYSDKAVSKWECGDTTPDLETLKSLADFYNISLDDLCKENGYQHQGEVKSDKAIIVKPLIPVISCTIPLLLSTIVYFLLLFFGYNHWTCFIWWMPVAALILFIFSWIYHQRTFRSVSGSVMVWTLLLSLYLELGVCLADGWRFWPVMFIGIPLTIALVLWKVIKVKPQK